MAKTNIKSLLGSGSSGSLLPKASAAKKGAATLQDLMQQNQKSRQRIEASGEADPTAKSKPSALERIFGPLDALGTGVRGIVYNAVSDKDVDVLGEMGKALKGERRVEGADILGEMGVDSKWGKLLGGLALNVLLDPVTYLSFGYGAAAKAAGKTAITTAAKSGGLALDDIMRLANSTDDIADVASGFAKVMSTSGDDVAELTAKLLSGEMKVPFGALEDAAANAVKHGLMGRAASALGDQGGIKILGQTVLPAQGAFDKASDVASLAYKTKPGDWFSKSLMSYGDKIPAGANSLERIAIPRMVKQASGVVAKGRHIGEQMARLMDKSLPDDAARNIFTVAIGREFGDTATRQGIDELYKAVRAAKDAGDDVALAAAENSLRQTLAQAYDPQAIYKTFIEAGYDDAAAKAAQEAAGKYHGLMDEMARLREDAGLDSWTLYGEYLPDGVSGSAGYARGQQVRQSTNLLGQLDKGTRKTLDTQQEALGKLGLSIDDATYGAMPLSVDDLTAGAGRVGMTPKLKLNARAYKSKEFKDAERAMVEGGLLTELDISKLASAKVASDYADIAADSLGKSLQAVGMPAERATELGKQFLGVLNQDEGVRGFLKSFDTVQSAWKKAATALRFPAFQNRNLLSNKILQAMKGVFDPESEVRAIDLMKRIHLGQLDDVGESEVRELIELGVIQTAEEFAELTRGAKFTSLPGRVFGGVNEAYENQSRVAAFYAGIKRGLDPESSARLVDEALYDYSNAARTAFEQGFMMRAIPFYKWTRQNLPNMVRTLFKEPGKVAWLGHLKESGEAVTDYDASAMPAWLRDLYPIPLPLEGKDGDPVMLSTAGLFPQGDLELLSGLMRGKFDPKDAFGMLTPLARTPIEILFNKSLFYDSPIERYPGEKKRLPASIEAFGDRAAQVPGLDKIWELIANRLGIEEREIDEGVYWVGSAKAMKALQDFAPWFNNVNKALDNQPKTPYDRFSFATGVKPILFEEEKFQRQAEYEDRATLNELIMRLKDEGRLAEPEKRSTLADVLGGR